ncbi:MAG: N-acetylmuramoyl-L-alanine amidase-like domain-containing protein [Thermodesulfobacteriota bacterium]
MILKPKRNGPVSGIRLIIFLFPVSIFFSIAINDFSSASDNKGGIFILGSWTEKDLNSIMEQSSKIQDVGERIDFLSGKFLNTEYEESTLVGDINHPEELVINLEGMDCFTYIDYVEAMQLSASYPMFVDNIQRIRYESGEVDFRKRNHFFTDWAVYNSDSIVDVTKEVGREGTRTVKKLLNRKEDGTPYLPGIPVKERTVNYIPYESIDDKVIGRLKTGDYIGIYTDKEGLDVSHTGILIRKGDKVYLRHASSRKDNRRVVDEELLAYLLDKPGLVVLRPKWF